MLVGLNGTTQSVSLGKSGLFYLFTVNILLIYKRNRQKWKIYEIQ